MTLAEIAHDRGIRYFLISFTDLFGVQRSKLVPAQAIDAMTTAGAGFAGFAAWLDQTPADPDIFAIPDPQSLIQLPWRPEVGWLAADLFTKGQPLAQTPRLVLQRVLQQAQALGYQVQTGVECEYFLLAADGENLADPLDHQTKPCYDQQSLMRRFEIISEICDAMLDLGWGAYQNDHEDANGQFEMNWLHADALVTADRHAFFKYMVKSIAEKHGFRATFMPKPFPHLTGNGCHTHLSVWDRSTGTNLFTDPQGELGLSALAYQFIAGVLHSAPALCAFTNPTVNSYKRLNAPATNSGATWSPNTISYGGNNRTHMIRIPEGDRFELRLADGAANPYLLPAALIASGLDGIAQSREPGSRADYNSYTDRPPVETIKFLPQNLLDALRCLEQDSIISTALGKDLTRAYLKLKHQEWQQYCNHISPWELKNSLDC